MSVPPTLNPDVPIPGREWYGGAWETPEQIARRRTRKKSYRSRPEVVEHEREYDRNYREQNRAKRNEVTREWRRKNAERVQTYKQKNADRVREDARRRRARLRAATIEPIPSALVALLERLPCFYCGDKGGTVDHVVPLALGGAHAPWNLVSCCSSCNSSKGTRPMPEFFIARAA